MHIKLTAVVGQARQMIFKKCCPYRTVSASEMKLPAMGAAKKYHEVEALARVLLPEIQAFFESEDGQREYAEWKAKQQAGQENKA